MRGSIKGNNMAKYEQGAAPEVMFENGEVVFAFRKGRLELSAVSQIFP